MIFDGHLDLAMNACHYERDQTADLEVVRQREAVGITDHRGQATTSLVELRHAGVAIVVATVIARCKPWVDPARPLWRDDLDHPHPAMSHAAAHGQLAYYRWLHRRGEIRLIGSAGELEAHLQQWAQAGERAALPVGVIVMMEGADPVTEAGELAHWYEQGVRCLSLAHYGHSRFAAGTPAMDPDSREQDAPLTPLGRELLAAMSDGRMILDLSHTADRSFAEAVDLFDGPICATHANCRSLVPSPRQLTDEQICTIVQRQGVVGIALHYAMLRAGVGRGLRAEQVTLEDVVDHVAHVCELANSSQHVAIGSDLDGGFGAEATPRGINRYRDLNKLADTLAARGFGDDAIANVLCENWRRFYRDHLPR